MLQTRVKAEPKIYSSSVKNKAILKQNSVQIVLDGA